MGLYDRDYSREPQSGYQLSAPQSASMQLLVATVGMYIVQVLFTEVTDYLQLASDWYRRPWEAYRLLTYGFAHDPDDVMHIAGNMLMLGFFGRYVEDRYGRVPFLTFYLVAILVGGLGWSLTQSLSGREAVMVGASAATTAVFLLFALNYPRQEVRLMFVIPMPAWVLALLIVGSDMVGTMSRQDSGGVAFMAHLFGAAFALAFYRFRWLPGQGVISWMGKRSLRPKPRLRVHEPDDEDEQDDLAGQVDKILEKIQQQGQDSLTRSERRLLEKASRQYQQKRK
jgi:membrane associated rhomboid family serine protease